MNINMYNVLTNRFRALKSTSGKLGDATLSHEYGKTLKFS